MLLVVLVLADEVLRAVPIHKQPCFGCTSQSTGCACEEHKVHAGLVHAGAHKGATLVHELATPAADAMLDDMLEERVFAIGQRPWHG